MLPRHWRLRLLIGTLLVACSSSSSGSTNATDAGVDGPGGGDTDTPPDDDALWSTVRVPWMYVMMPFISGFIGWSTNWLALKMTFYPLEVLRESRSTTVRAPFVVASLSIESVGQEDSRRNAPIPARRYAGRVVRPNRGAPRQDRSAIRRHASAPSRPIL